MVIGYASTCLEGNSIGDLPGGAPGFGIFLFVVAMLMEAGCFVLEGKTAATAGSGYNQWNDNQQLQG